MCYVTIYHLQCMLILNDVSSEVEVIREEVVMAHFNVLFSFFQEGWGETMKNLSSWYCALNLN